MEFNETAREELEIEGNELLEFTPESDEDETYVYKSPRKADKEGTRTLQRKDKRLMKAKLFGKHGKQKVIRQNIHETSEKNEFGILSDYKILKDSICVGCSKELSKEKQEGSKNLYSGKTGGGRNFYDIFVSIIESEVSLIEFGSLMCRKCCTALDQIEFYYQEWRSLVDGFRDTFLLGQKSLDADLGGVPNCDIDNEVTNVVQTMDMHKNAVVKVLDQNSLQSFTPLGMGMADFHCR